MHTSDGAGHTRHGECRTSRGGPSSFAMQDASLVFRALELTDGATFLDMGCGPGDYALHAARIVGDTGLVYALDKWRYLIKVLVDEANRLGLKNIMAVVSDITQPLPIKECCVDVCFMATVLHTLNLAEDGTNLFAEIRRVLKPGRQLAILNCKKEDQPFGPPLRMRWSPDEVEEALTDHRFEKVGYVDLGYNYLIQFIVRQSDNPTETLCPTGSP